MRYEIRAGLEYEFQIDDEHESSQLILPRHIPTDIGPFLLDKSPNTLYYLAQQGYGYDLLSDNECIDLDGLPPNTNFPNSIYYIQTSIEIGDDENPDSYSEDIFNKFEAILRLFQRGGIYVRRVFGEGMVINDTYSNWAIRTDIEQIPIKPQIKPLYPRKSYKFDDETIESFKLFFPKYWPIIFNKPMPIWAAIYRFSLSYERRTLGERMAELMLSMEPIFGNYLPQFTEIASNFSKCVRASSLITEPIMDYVNNLFSKRKQILYDGSWGNDPRNIDYADQLEDLLREAILKLLGDASNQG